MAANNDSVIICDKCVICEKEINIEDDKFLICSNKKCRKCFHPKCIHLSEIKFKKYEKDKHKVWFCEACLDVQTEKIHQRHPATRGFTKTSETTVAQVHETTSKPDSEPIQMNKITSPEQVNDVKFMKEIHRIVKEIRDEQSNMHKQIKCLTESTNEMKNKMETLFKSNEELKTENEFLRKNLDNCNYRINNFEQNILVNNLEICGIAEEKNESINDILNKIDQFVGNVLQEEDVICFYRKHERVNNSAGLPRPIVVQLRNNNIKRKFMKSCKSKGKNLNTGLVSSQKPVRPIYVNHQLTKLTSFLFMNTKKEIKNGKFKFVWVQNGKVLTRRADSGPIQQIYNINHLNGIVSKY